MVGKNHRIVAIIQARMASSRLPGKVLLPLGPDDNSVLWWMLKRTSLAKLVDEAVIATTLNHSNQPIRKAFSQQTWSWAGNENDVMSRVLWVAKKTNADIIVDLSSDCPLVDPRHIDYLIETLLDYEREYMSNCIYRNWPDGLDIQVYLTKTLQECKRLFAPKQHCGWNIAQQTKTFDIDHWDAPSDMHWPELGLTLDTPEDYKLLKIIFDKFGHNPNFYVEDIIYYLREYPELVEINKKVRRKMPEEG